MSEAYEKLAKKRRKNKDQQHHIVLDSSYNSSSRDIPNVFEDSHDEQPPMER